jgi:hypothetical protein
MIVKPNELPKAEDVKIDPALKKVTNWRLENTDDPPDPDRALAFVDSHVTSFFGAMRRAFKLIDKPESPS